jgi:hypothetical protein
MIARLLCLSAFCGWLLITSACVTPSPIETQTKSEVIEVRIPPSYDPGRTAGENQCVFSLFLFPPEGSQFDEDSCSGAGVANDDSLLYLTLERDGSFRLNGQSEVNGKSVGGVNSKRLLTKTLASLFAERERNGVFEPGGNRIVKAVGVRIPNDQKFSEVISILRSVKESGADPIVLLLEGHLPDQPMGGPQVK